MRRRRPALPAGRLTELRLAGAAKKGVHGGNMVSPVMNREDALIMWRDPELAEAQAS
jgi:hypothetical protein